MGIVLSVSRRGAIVSHVLVIASPDILVPDVAALQGLPFGCRAWDDFEKTVVSGPDDFEKVVKDKVKSFDKSEWKLPLSDIIVEQAIQFGRMLMPSEEFTSPPKSSGDAWDIKKPDGKLNVHAYTHMMILLHITSTGVDLLGLASDSGVNQCQGIYGNVESVKKEVQQILKGFKPLPQTEAKVLQSDHLGEFYRAHFTEQVRPGLNLYEESGPAWALGGGEASSPVYVFSRKVTQFKSVTPVPSFLGTLTEILGFNGWRTENSNMLFAYHYLMTKEWFAVHVPSVKLEAWSIGKPTFDLRENEGSDAKNKPDAEMAPKELSKVELQQPQQEEEKELSVVQPQQEEEKELSVVHVENGMFLGMIGAVLLLVYMYGKDMLKKILPGAKQEDVKQGAEEHGSNQNDKGIDHEAVSLSYELTPFIPSHSNFDSNGNDHSSAPGCFAGQGCSAP